MLVVTRKNQESLMIGGLNPLELPIVVTVLEITNGRVTLGITASDHMPVDRLEIHQQHVLLAEGNSDHSNEPAA